MEKSNRSSLLNQQQAKTPNDPNNRADHQTYFDPEAGSAVQPQMQKLSESDNRSSPFKSLNSNQRGEIVGTSRTIDRIEQELDAITSNENARMSHGLKKDQPA